MTSNTKTPPYLLTAYGIAVKNGYSGTEQQWLASLKGAKGDTPLLQFDAETGYLQYRYSEEEEWTNIASLEDLMTEGEAAVIASAKNYSDLAEAYAKGTVDGEPVPSGDPGDEDNAKYYAGQAQTSAEAADDSADTAAASATDAAGSAEAAGTYSYTASQHAAGAAQYASTASSMASNAALSAGSSATSAQTAQTQAGLAATHASDAYQHSQTAVNYAQAAQTYASNAATYASSAATSAENVSAYVTAAAAAQTAAEAAQTAAEAAETNAETAQTAAETAQTGAEAAQAAAEAVLESIPEDYSAMSADVTDLKSAHDENTDILSLNTNISVPYKIAGVGSINFTTGEVLSSSVYDYTDYIDVSMYSQVTYTRIKQTASSSNVNYGIALYDVNKNYVNGKRATTGALAKGYATDTIYIGKNVKYIRTTIWHDTATYGTFSISGIPRSTDVIDKGKNLWAYGDVNVTDASGTKHIFLDTFLPAGNYTLELDLISNKDESGTIYFLKSTGTAIQTADSVCSISVSKTAHTKRSITLSNTAKAIAFCAGNRISASSGYKAYFQNITLLAGDEYDNTAVYNSAKDNAIDVGSQNARIIDYSADFIKGGSIVTSGTTADINAVVTSADYRYLVIPCKAGDEFVTVNFGQVSYRAWAFIDDSGNVLARSPATGGVDQNRVLTPYRLRTPINATKLILNHYAYAELGWKPKAFKLSGNPIVDKAAFDNHVLPYIEKDVWKRQVVATYDKYYVILDNGVLKRSADSGKTWNSGVNISSLDPTVGYHLYATGTLAFFTNTKAYYIDDWTAYHEATCYEADGVTQCVPEGTHCFDALHDVAERKFINGQDMYVFGNYTTSDSTRRVVWYSIDDGHTYRIAYEFNLESTYPARHVHDVMYYSRDDAFIVTTGDSNATECRVFTFRYDVENDSWTTEVLGGSSRSYKWAGMAIWGDDIYYCFDNTPGKVLRCKYADIGDLTKHEEIIGTSTSDIATIAIGPRGDMVVGFSRSRSTGGATLVFPLSANVDCRKIWYSSNRKDFAEIILDPQILDTYSARSRSLPVNAEGHFICGFHGDGTTNWNHLPSALIDDYIRLAGFKDAFKPL